MAEPHLHQEIWTFDIHAKSLVEILLGGSLEILHSQNPCIRDEDVNLPESINRVSNQALDLGNAANIGLDGVGTVAANFFDYFIRSVCIRGVVDDHVSASLGKTYSCCFPDSFGTARDEGNLAQKTR